MTINLLGIPSIIINWSITILIVAIIVRVFASWFGLDERFAFIRFLARMTDPLLNPVRRILPRIGMFDFSFIVVSLALISLRILFLQSLPALW